MQISQEQNLKPEGTAMKLKISKSRPAIPQKRKHQNLSFRLT